ncbi:MAG: helix-turn-helix domain-containing protein [Thermoplasmatales archaeon]|nr:helix-turn-helix domain-containing protein [Thermoplasmatales archaeon]
MKLKDINKRLDVVLNYIMKKETTWKICRENDISARTLRRWVKNYHENGISGLEPKPTIPKNQSNKVSENDEKHIVKTKLEHPSYGSRMINTLKEITG